MGIKNYIGRAVADRDLVEHTVRKLAKKTKDGANWEEAFVYEFLLKNVHSYLLNIEKDVLGGRQPRDFILAESTRAKKEGMACGTPAKSSGHPFNKTLGRNPGDLYLRWRGQDRKGRTAKFAPVCPDVALLAPYRIVFECKYFNQRAAQPAALPLVEGLFQAFFYRAVPTFAPGTTGLKHGWDYEYSCFLAYDATQNQRLGRAWDALEEIHKRFWDESNIFVIILPLLLPTPLRPV